MWYSRTQGRQLWEIGNNKQSEVENTRPRRNLNQPTVSVSENTVTNNVKVDNNGPRTQDDIGNTKEI